MLQVVTYATNNISVSAHLGDDGGTISKDNEHLHNFSRTKQIQFVQFFCFNVGQIY